MVLDFTCFISITSLKKWYQVPQETEFIPLPEEPPSQAEQPL
jgi:hypothetical protein